MASPSFARVMGYASVDEALGMDLASEFYEHPSQRAEILERLEAEGSVTDFEVTVRRRDGSIVEGAVTGNFYRDAAGNVRGVEGVLRDMTARNAPIASSPRPRHRSRHLLEAAGDGIFGVDCEGQVTFLNPAAEEMLGWSAGSCAASGSTKRSTTHARTGRPTRSPSVRSTSPTRRAWSAASTTRCSGGRTARASPSSTSRDRFWRTGN